MKRFFLLSMLLTVLSPFAMQSQTMDQKAYNLFWQRLEEFSGITGPNEVIHLLTVYREATWAEDNNPAALADLYEFGSMIPSIDFTLTPSYNNLRLHEQYGKLISYVEWPDEPTDEQKANYDEAQKEWIKYTDEYFNAVNEYNTKFREYWDFLNSKEIKMNNYYRRHFRKMHGRILIPARRKYKDAYADLLRYTDNFKVYRDALTDFDEYLESSGTAAEDIGEGENLYNGGMNELSGLKKCSVDSEDGWREIIYSKTIDESYVKHGGWNVNGSWGGSAFFGGLSLGGGKTTYSSFFSNDSEKLIIKFCNLRFIPIKPAKWYNASLLQAIKDGNVKLREGNPLEDQPLYGTDGYMPRLLKGIIVTKDVAINSTLSETRSKEIRKKVKGKGGFGFGKFRIGGRAGSSSVNKWSSNETGSFKANTNSKNPIIIAVVTETTTN